jgi:lysophospholipase L1-like esterase
MKRKHIFFASLFAITTWLFVRPKKVNAFKPNLSLHLVGDSQTKRHLGKAYEEIFQDFKVSYFGKEGASFTDYVNDPELFKDAFKCADIIIIQIGDNGIPNRPKAFSQFLTNVKNKCPQSKLIFAGPMKAVKPSIKSSFVNTTNPESVRYLPNYNRIRRMWNERLQNWLKKENIPYFNNYNTQENQPLDSDFSDNRKGDGVHLTKESAREQARLMCKYIYDLLERV